MKRAGKLAFAVRAMITLFAVKLSWHSAQGQRQKDPHEMTAIGVISEPIRKVWIHGEVFAASRLSMMRIMARRKNAAAVVA
jgi:hypothetical protein